MSQNHKLTRREMLKRTGHTALLAGVGFPFITRGEKQGLAGARRSQERWPHGAVVGENAATVVGENVLESGGNAIDAAVAAAFIACISAPARSGIGGYGG